MTRLTLERIMEMNSELHEFADFFPYSQWAKGQIIQMKTEQR
jgi:hypothetical protein